MSQGERAHLVNFDLLLAGHVHGVVGSVVWLRITFRVLARQVRAREEYEDAASRPAGGEDRPGDVISGSTALDCETVTGGPNDGPWLISLLPVLRAGRVAYGIADHDHRVHRCALRVPGGCGGGPR